MAFQIIVRCDALGMFAADIYFTDRYYQYNENIYVKYFFKNFYNPSKMLRLAKREWFKIFFEFLQVT